MRSEKEMYDLILDIAKRDERIRAVYMNGSRANQRRMTNAKQPDALCLSGLHNPLNILNFKDFCRPVHMASGMNKAYFA